MVGDGKLRENLQNKATLLGIEDRLVFMGYQKNVIELMAEADIMLMPSKIEGLPGVILEAMSCGLPVVASDVGGISEVITEGYTGYLVNDFDAAKYLNRIELLLNNNSIYKNIQLNAIELIKNTYLMYLIAVKFTNTYKEILKI